MLSFYIAWKCLTGVYRSKLRTETTFICEDGSINECQVRFIDAHFMFDLDRAES